MKPAVKLLLQCHRIAGGLTALDLVILERLHTADGQGMTELAAYTRQGKATINRAVRTLIGKNMVDMTDTEDVFITPYGRGKLEALVVNARHFFSS